jgi:hypothetical protein
MLQCGSIVGASSGYGSSGTGARVGSALSSGAAVPTFRLHFRDDPGRVDVIDGEESDVVATILAAHPARSMELWRRAALVRIFGRPLQVSFLASTGHRSRHGWVFPAHAGEG